MVPLIFGNSEFHPFLQIPKAVDVVLPFFFDEAFGAIARLVDL